jgi:hypothetical protein
MKKALFTKYIFFFIDVCTIRLDFETFDIQGPTLTTEQNAAGTACLDSFIVKVIYCRHHAEGLVDPKVLAKVTDFGYPRACRFRKHQIENRSPFLNLITFFKT